MKRLLDLTAGLIGLVVALPALILIALWIRLDSPGPIFYRGLTAGATRNPFEFSSFAPWSSMPTKSAGFPVRPMIPEARGTGLSEHLFRSLVEFLRERGVEEMKIATGDNQIRAQKFYEKIGAQRVGNVVVHSGRVAVAYMYRIPAN
jgi:GNAT superfamily N-acetyltransferase